ncbi:MAG: ribosome small subunit-dependent GTPase A [Tenuifilaceae bacterium]|jgi:ribosome biogenesis GTPase|nr:ribosome small subunit-dependent GTPase A [Bacteroidales bacterium]MDI9516306.1 ribosome small subunit-dependent GTPase A [Bacteroidota bacterium]NLH55543.1 ribosome small subunit-dependent GTPase A [Rikenellaceae bacterium]OQC61598.1 MAG: putative ribosome biogenesis GTPase RsgA [Bacteroidetes bacterium ADurb.Bin008]HNV81468.1 ribosome small subunit-dependent GTPase A [Tenuifilaceae bacterium]
MQGRVLKSTGSWYTILGDDGLTYKCTVRGKLRLKSSRTTNPITVGDKVEFDIESDGQTGNVRNVLPRKNYIIRKSSNLSRESHIIAANIDQAMLVVTVDFPETNLVFIDRYLATAEAYQIPAILLFNKIDLRSDAQFDAKLNHFESIYKPIYPCHRVSAKTGEGLEEVRKIILGRVSLFSGNSGVGKSALINRLDPTLNLKTADISHYHLKGRHTTTFSEMFALNEGGFIIDTPGIKGFGLVDMDKREIFHFFPEIFKISANCLYHNCTHQDEPGCAVKDAVEKNIINPSRYINYLSIMNNSEGKYR